MTLLLAMAGAPVLIGGALPPMPSRHTQAAASPDLEAGRAAAAVECSGCHKVPAAEILPRTHWRDEVARMFLIRTGRPEPAGPRGTAARIVALPAAWQAIARYYEAHAPERLAPPAAWPAPGTPSSFRRRPLAAPSGAAAAAVANVRLLDLDGDGRLELTAADMRGGGVYVARPYEAEPQFVAIARLANPAHVTPSDLDADGVLDLLVADLGRFAPSDHDRGAIVWLRGRKDGGHVPTAVAYGPRVADVEAADFDGDGALDIVTARFGWRKTGDLSIFRRQPGGAGTLSFSRHTVDQRTGAIHALPADLDGDKRPDVVAVFAQEHETVIAYLNSGGMRFEPRVIYAAPHPGWGFSGIQVVDVDKDGDLDVLATNGDVFDDLTLKPYHGIRWLENTGTFPFAEHVLADLPGAYRAQAVDLDNDGDHDVVACALAAVDDREARGVPAVVWLEQTRPGVFERRTLAAGPPVHATLDAGDFDRDGDVDLVVGTFPLDGRPATAMVEVFENLRVGK